MKNPEFLKQKYDLHNSPEAAAAAKSSEVAIGRKVPQNPEARIENYLARLEQLALDPEKKQARKMFGGEPRPRALAILREMVMDKYVRPNKDKLAQGAAQVEERAARELGIEARYGQEELAERGEIAVADLEKSLDNWILYLSDLNEPYPVWFRYYAFRNILDLGDYDKDKGEFTKRSKGSTRLFPDIDRGALAYVEQMIEASRDPKMLERLIGAQQTAARGDIPADQLITKEKAQNFAQLSFAKQYAEGIRQAGAITPEMRAETKGQWVKYQKGTDPTALWASLQNKGTAWCTKGFATAETQLKGGDFYVYYTLDRQGKPAIPRVAIRMQGDSIGEVRGVSDTDQNLEGNVVDIANAKMSELPGAERYRKISVDMKRLTAIDKKTKAGKELTTDDLLFLYEINSSIEGFGYKKDPRIKALQDKRNPQEDAPIVFECKPEEIANSKENIKKTTKGYIGNLEPGVFEALPEGIENIYTAFPEGKIRKENIKIGGKTSRELIDELQGQKINVSPYAEAMLKSEKFTVSKKSENLTLVRLKVKDLGFRKEPTIDQIYERAKSLGLDLCPAEVGPHLRLQYQDQPLGEWFYIAMKQISDRVQARAPWRWLVAPRPLASPW